MLVFINNVLDFVKFRLANFSENWVAYVVLMLIASVFTIAATVIQYNLTKYKKQTKFLQLVSNLCSSVYLYGFLLGLLFLFSNLNSVNITSSYIFVDAVILCLGLLCVYSILRIFVLTPILSIVHLIRFITRKNRAKTVKTKQVNKQSTNKSINVVEQICEDFTRNWIVKKLEEFPEQNRYQIINSYKSEYIEELEHILPRDCNRTKTALYYHSHYCSLWK